MALTAKERVKKSYNNRKNNGLCVRCGNKLDRQGCICIDCLRENAKYHRDMYHWYQDAGICPYCRKNSILGDEKLCLECRALRANQESARREKNIEKFRAYQRETKKLSYQSRKESGLCVSCGKPLSDIRYVRCERCRKRNAYKQKMYKNRNGMAKITPKERYEQGMCWFCENLHLPGYKVCEEHRIKLSNNANSENAKKARKKLIEDGILY